MQKELAKLCDRTRLRSHEATLRRQCTWGQLEALRDLGHKDISHKWLWHLDSRRGTVLAPCDYIVIVQRRLGARIYNVDAQCRICGCALDPQVEHSDCCDPAGATRGHYAVVRELVRGLKLADPGFLTEPRRLTTTESRPADILTSAAVPGRSAALDVCVASPNASGAAGDAAEAAFRRKLNRYRTETRELDAAGITFRPMVWTSHGRPHPAVTRTLSIAAEQAASRSSHASDAATLLARWRHEIKVAILRRRAAMVRACLPQAASHTTWLLTGYTSKVPSSTVRASPLEEDPDDHADDAEPCEGEDMSGELQHDQGEA